MGCTSSASAKEQGLPRDDYVPEKIRDPWKDFKDIKVLGDGASCQVHMVEHKKTKKRYAMKVMKKGESDMQDMFLVECRIMRALNHKNVLKFHDAFQDGRHWYIMSVLCRGGDLFDRITSGSFSERDAARIARDMLLGVEHCHSKGVVHRDLKPENYVFETNKTDSPLQLIDFGCAKALKMDEVSRDLVGSAYYIAPEVLHYLPSKVKRRIESTHPNVFSGQRVQLTGRVWRAADMWSIGIIIYLLMHGYPPFSGGSDDRTFGAILSGKYRFSSRLRLSDELKDLVRNLLKKNPVKRLTAKQALEHPWIKNADQASDKPLPPDVIQGLTQFRDQCRLKKAVAHLLTERMTDDDKKKLDELFRRFDENGDGELSADEVAKMLKHIGNSEAEAKEIMDGLDENDDGVLDKDEFAQMIAMGKLSMAKEDDDDDSDPGGHGGSSHVNKAWRILDKDGDGFITVDELGDMLKMNERDAKQLIHEVDSNSDGRISFDEFLAAMRSSKVSDLAQKRSMARKRARTLKSNEKDQEEKKKQQKKNDKHHNKHSNNNNSSSSHHKSSKKKKKKSKSKSSDDHHHHHHSSHHHHSHNHSSQNSKKKSK